MRLPVGKFFSGRAQWDHPGTLAGSLIDITFYPVEVTLVDAGHKIVIVLYRRILLSYDSLAAIDKRLQSALGYEAVVRADAELAAVHGLAGDDALCGEVNITVFADNNR